MIYVPEEISTLFYCSVHPNHSADCVQADVFVFYYFVSGRTLTHMQANITQSLVVRSNETIFFA